MIESIPESDKNNSANPENLSSKYCKENEKNKEIINYSSLNILQNRLEEYKRAIQFFIKTENTTKAEDARIKAKEINEEINC